MLQPRTSVLTLDKVVDKLCALIVSDNLIKWLIAGVFRLELTLVRHRTSYPAPIQS